MNSYKIKCGNFEIANNKQFTLIAGPCQMENESHAIQISTELKKITTELKINLIYKSSFDKANRSSGTSFRGPGMEEGLRVLAEVKKQIGVPVLTDVHEDTNMQEVAEVVDVPHLPC